MQRGVAAGLEFLGSVASPSDPMPLLTPDLQPAPDGAFILTHNRKPQSTQQINFVISLRCPSTYAVLATLDSPLRIPLPTYVTIRGQPFNQMVNINLIPHNHSLLGRQYSQLLTDPNIIHLNPQATPLSRHPSKGLQGRRSD